MIEDFLKDRLGSLGASDIGKALSVLSRASGGRSPGEPTQGAYDLQFLLASEVLTGFHPYCNPLQWGNQTEDEAREVYAATTNEPVIHLDISTGKRLVIPHPTIRGSHACPDGLVGDEGGVELKCPTSLVHLKTLYFKEIPEEHLPQIHWNMACTGRLWWDFQSYDPRFIHTEHQRFVKRVRRDETLIAQMGARTQTFLVRKDAIIDRVTRDYSI